MFRKPMLCEPLLVARKSAELLGLISGIGDGVFERKAG
jgi:hypothetical protein